MSSLVRACGCPISQPCTCYRDNQLPSTPFTPSSLFIQYQSLYPASIPFLSNSYQSHHLQSPLFIQQPYIPPPPPVLPLANTTNFVNHTPASLSSSLLTSSTGKRKNTPNSQPTAKRARPAASSATVSTQSKTPVPSLPVPAAHGVGPSLPAPNATIDTSSQPPAFSCLTDEADIIHRSLLTPDPTHTDHSLASDVWYCTCGLVSNQKPAQMLPDWEKRSRQRPDKEKYKYLGCILCPFDRAWTTWKNTEGQSKTIQNHLHKHHFKIWRELVVMHQLKGWDALPEPGVSTDEEDLPPFSVAEFHKLLVKWISADDQSMSVVECPELRKIFRFIGQHCLEDEDIPRRTKMGSLVTEYFHSEYEAMKQELKDAEGRVLLTTDIWSRTNLEGYMGITAHFIVKVLKTYTLRNELIAFRHIKGTHSGANIGKEMYNILENVGITNKLGHITTDNASNNSTMMEEMVKSLEGLGVPFHAKSNHIRCFPHVINLAVKAIIGALIEPWALPENASQADIEYHAALKADLVGRVRRFSTFVRSSGQRREAFEQAIKEINEAGGFGEAVKKLMRLVGLLKDMEVRWSANMYMVDRFLEQYPACERFIDNSSDWELEQYKFTKVELQVLTDYRELLHVFHLVQEVVSAEKMPTLSIVLPLYEKLTIVLANFSISKPQLKHAVEPAIDKLKKYMSEARSSKAYALAMVLNPTIKFTWLKNNWTNTEYLSARITVFEVLLEFSRASSNQSTTSSGPTRRTVTIPTISSAAAQAQKVGMDNFNKLARSISKSAIAAAASGSTVNSATPPTLAPCSSAPNLVLSDEQHKQAVTREIRDYEEAGLMGDNEAGELDLIRYWQERKYQYPLLFKLALNVLPIQASAVPSERVFSSSKETDTLRCANLGQTLRRLSISLSPIDVPSLTTLFRPQGKKISFPQLQHVDLIFYSSAENEAGFSKKNKLKQAILDLRNCRKASPVAGPLSVSVCFIWTKEHRSKTMYDYFGKVEKDFHKENVDIGVQIKEEEKDDLSYEFLEDDLIHYFQ
ncbi:hypothetical protein CVT24_004169 [Panaeolus cyanescens]|uniref:HAT C-terminal dimerisation domain-containing protein n=1 Tax=Panaeolus cyanescens TaxID=181874 RepID=A0A409YX67_9AGAR|nr:hypothetical protein CVT24_004169 [Panaeolus cyanescens]